MDNCEAIVTPSGIVCVDKQAHQLRKRIFGYDPFFDPLSAVTFHKEIPHIRTCITSNNKQR